MAHFKSGLMKYCVGQEQKNTPFVSKALWKDKIKRIRFLKLIVYFFNDGDGLHTLLRGSTALVDVGLLIVEVARSHSNATHKVGFLLMRDRSVAETTALQHTQNLTRDGLSYSRDSKPQSQ